MSLLDSEFKMPALCVTCAKVFSSEANRNRHILEVRNEELKKNNLSNYEGNFPFMNELLFKYNRF